METPKPRIVETHEQARALLLELQQAVPPFGLDCETERINPKKESPVGRGRIVFWSIAWEDATGEVHSATLYGHLLHIFREFLRTAPVVGHNFWRFDRHVFANEGIELENIVADTLRQSQLSYSDTTYGHDLKTLSARWFNEPRSGFKDLFTRPGRLAPKSYKKFTRQKPTEARPWERLTCPGEYCRFSIAESKREIIPLSAIPADYPQRLDTLVTYAAQDASDSLRLDKPLRAQLRKMPARPPLYANLEELHDKFWNPLCRTVSNMERRGICLDTVVCAVGYRETSARAAELETELKQVADIQYTSYDQLRVLLYDDMRLPVPPITGGLKNIKKAAPGERSTSEAALYWLELNCPEQRDFLGMLRQYRKVKKYGQYHRDLPGYLGADNRLHAVMGPDTATGRLAVRNPALQQIPGTDPYGIRRAFVPATGRVLVVADYSQLEVYVLAHVLIRLFGDHSIANALATGDVYGSVAKQCWPDALAGIEAHEIKHHADPQVQYWRKMAKIVVLATNYLKTPEGLAISLLDETGESVGLEFALGLLTRYFSVFPGVQEYHKWAGRFARENRGIATLAGRWRPLPHAISDWDGDRQQAARQAANTPIQGSAADIMGAAMIAIEDDPDLPGAQLLQIHDEIIAEGPADQADELLARISAHMIEPRFDLAVPLKVDAAIAGCWADGK